MSTGKRRVFDREFKLSVVQRLIAGESPAALCNELQLDPSHLSHWWTRYRRHGPEGLRRTGRPRKDETRIEPVVRAEDLGTARKRIGELERKIGQQQVDLDFFRRALRHVRETRRPSDGLGVKASTL
jgi:transposase